MVASGFDPTVARSDCFEVAFDPSGEPSLVEQCSAPDGFRKHVGELASYDYRREWQLRQFVHKPR